MNTGLNIISYDKIAKLLLEGKKCSTCLYYQSVINSGNWKSRKYCNKMIAVGGSKESLPKENICIEWTCKND